MAKEIWEKRCSLGLVVYGDAVQYGRKKTSAGVAPDHQGRSAPSGWIRQQRTDQKTPPFPQLTDVCLSECLLNRRGSLDPMQQNCPQALLSNVISKRFVLLVSICVNVSECAHEVPREANLHRNPWNGSQVLVSLPDWILDSNAGFCKSCTRFQ